MHAQTLRVLGGSTQQVPGALPASVPTAVLLHLSRQTMISCCYRDTDSYKCSKLEHICVYDDAIKVLEHLRPVHGQRTTEAAADTIS